MEGDVYKMVYEYEEAAEGNERPADYIQGAFWDVFHKGDHCGYYQTDTCDKGECEAEEPTAVIYQINVKHEQCYSYEINRSEDDGIGTVKPQRKNKNNVCGHDSADNVARPGHGVVYTEVTDERKKNGEQENDGQHHHKSETAYLFVDALEFWVRVLYILWRFQFGMVHR